MSGNGLILFDPGGICGGPIGGVASAGNNEVSTVVVSHGFVIKQLFFRKSIISCAAARGVSVSLTFLFPPVKLFSKPIVFIICCAFCLASGSSGGLAGKFAPPGYWGRFIPGIFGLKLWSFPAL